MATDTDLYRLAVAASEAPARRRAEGPAWPVLDDYEAWLGLTDETAPRSPEAASDTDGI